jgi:regulator of RNase E activity RraB
MSKEVANKLYVFIPNIYSCFDPIYLSYVLEEAIVKAPKAYTKCYARYAQNWEADRKVCENLRQNGDALTEPREIDFSIRFKKESDIDGVAEKLLEQGFTEAGRGKTENGEYGLSLTLNAIPELTIMNKITSQILSLLAYSDATYDGWGCAVVWENVFNENSQIGI